MKEYWVNVYKYDYIIGIYYSRESAIDFGKQLGGGIGYRLHVREFETREAKELYLKMKYGKPVKYYWNYGKLKPLLMYNKSSLHDWMNR